MAFCAADAQRLFIARHSIAGHNVETELSRARRAECIAAGLLAGHSAAGLSRPVLAFSR